MQNLVKLSNKRLIRCGNSAEFYVYEHPFSYNHPPIVRSAHGTPSGQRRVDNARMTQLACQRLIRANERQWGELAKFITYTFAKHVTDVVEANRIWIEYARLLREKYGKVRYVGVIEFQKSGRVHYHVLFFNLPWIADIKRKFQADWYSIDARNGFTKVIALATVRDVALYVSKYMTKECADPRLAGQKAYFSTRGLFRPILNRDPILINRLRTRYTDDTVWQSLVREYVSERWGTVSHTLFRAIT